VTKLLLVIAIAERRCSDFNRYFIDSEELYTNVVQQQMSCNIFYSANFSRTTTSFDDDRLKL